MNVPDTVILNVGKVDEVAEFPNHFVAPVLIKAKILAAVSETVTVVADAVPLAK